MKKIEVKNKVEKRISIEKLQNFQGTLKELSRNKYEKLKKSILKYGFRIPIFIWGNNILDGHQRVFVLKQLKNEGYEIPEIPVVEIEAKDLQEAKKLLLLINSRYGKITEEGLYEFIQDLNWEEIKKELDFADINIRDFEEGWIKDKEMGISEKGEVEFTEELLEEHNYIVLYFDNKIDWLQLQSLYPLKRVKALNSKNNYEKIGVGRVIRGADFLNYILGDRWKKENED